MYCMVFVFFLIPYVNVFRILITCYVILKWFEEEYTAQYTTAQRCYVFDTCLVCLVFHETNNNLAMKTNPY